MSDLFRRGGWICTGCISHPRMWPFHESLRPDSASVTKVVQSDSLKSGHFINGQSRRTRPGACCIAMSAASHKSVPLPHIGSTNTAPAHHSLQILINNPCTRTFLPADLMPLCHVEQCSSRWFRQSSRMKHTSVSATVELVHRSRGSIISLTYEASNIPTCLWMGPRDLCTR